MCREPFHVHKGDYVAYGPDDDYDPDGYGCMNVAPGLYRIVKGPDVQGKVRRFDKGDLERVDDPPEGEDIYAGEASAICRYCAEAWIAGVQPMHGPAVIDGCEWNPATDAPAYDTDDHHRLVPAEVLVGANGKYRTCSSCADLPRFKRFKKKLLTPRGARSRVAG